MVFARLFYLSFVPAKEVETIIDFTKKFAALG